MFTTIIAIVVLVIFLVILGVVSLTLLGMWGDLKSHNPWRRSPPSDGDSK
jgi:hypothetical protein